MSALWGARIQRAGVLVVLSMLPMGLVSCEYSTEDDRPAPTSAAASAAAQSFEQNLATVKELLNGTEASRPLKHETGRTPGWSAELAGGL